MTSLLIEVLYLQRAIGMAGDGRVRGCTMESHHQMIDTLRLIDEYGKTFNNWTMGEGPAM